MGQSYDDEGQCLRLLNAAEAGQEVSIAEAAGSLKATMIETLIGKRLSRYRSQNGAAILENGLANWQSSQKSTKEHAIMSEALGEDMAVCGLYAKEYFVSFPERDRIVRYDNPHLGIAIVIRSQ